jgi:membrane-associated phospholipid phosphatase
MTKYFLYMLYAFIAFGLVDTARRHFRRDLFRTWWKGRVLFLLALLLPFACLVVDGKAGAFVRSLEALKGTLQFFNNFGDGKYLFPALLLVCFAGRALGQVRLEKVFGTALFASVAAGLLGQVVQLVFMRARPNVTSSAWDFFNQATALAAHKMGSVDYRSFPSGHAIVIFAAVSGIVLALRDRTPRGLRPFLYALYAIPVLTSLARVYLDRHWLSDTVMSAVLGIATASFFVHAAGISKSDARSGLS